MNQYEFGGQGHANLFCYNNGPLKSTDPYHSNYLDDIFNMNVDIGKIVERERKWDLRFLELAKLVSTWSKDPSTKVGAVITDTSHRIISIGYNGFPQGVNDSEERLNNRDIKYEIVVHGEMNAILFANRSLKGCVLYTWPFGPCSRCASMVIQSGIEHVVFPKTTNERWVKAIELSKQLFKEANVEVTEIELETL